MRFFNRANPSVRTLGHHAQRSIVFLFFSSLPLLGKRNRGENIPSFSFIPCVAQFASTLPPLPTNVLRSTLYYVEVETNFASAYISRKGEEGGNGKGALVALSQSCTVIIVISMHHSTRGRNKRRPRFCAISTAADLTYLVLPLVLLCFLLPRVLPPHLSPPRVFNGCKKEEAFLES